MAASKSCPRAPSFGSICAAWHPRRSATTWRSTTNYAVKTWDSFLLRRSRGNGAKPEGGTDRWDRAYFDTRAKGGIEDTTILCHAPAVEAALADLRALPGVAEAEAEVHARYRALLQAALREAG